LGVLSAGALPSGQVGATCAARQDMPHRVHTSRVCPGVSGRRVKCPRMPGASSAVSRGRTCRAAPLGSVATGPGLGSTFPHVAREPRPVSDGGSGVGRSARGRGGRASGPNTKRVSAHPPASASSGKISGGTPPPVPLLTCGGCGGTVCIATRAIHPLFPTISVVYHPCPPSPGRGAPTCSLPSPRDSRGEGGRWLEHAPD